MFSVYHARRRVWLKRRLRLAGVRFANDMDMATLRRLFRETFA